MIDETKQHAREAQAASARGRGALDTYATMFRERGLSSDTSLAVNFALDRAVEALAAQQALARGRVRRVAIVGPGLDFTDKAEGYDVYSVQTIQPFALIDALLRHQLSTAAALRVTTFDLSPRVNEHLRGAVARAKSGEPYVLQLPLARDDPSHTWEPALDRYWRTCGSAIGKETTPVAVSAAAGRVDLRAIAVRPEIAASISPMDLDVVVQRLAPLADDEKFDLIVATNVLLYYDPFEQSLALANVGSMLRPGGVFLTNYQVHPPPPFEGTASVVTPVFWDAQKNGDTMFGYRFAAGGRP
jgi:SAM-dependent methyltransferase